MASESVVEVVRGFEAVMRANAGIIQRAGSVDCLLDGRSFDEFAPTVTETYRILASKGATMRILTVSAPSSRDIAMEVVKAGVPLRVLSESRELGMLLTDTEAFVFPLGQEAEGPLREVAVHLRDLLVVAHLKLAFDKAWLLGKPHP